MGLGPVRMGAPIRWAEATDFRDVGTICSMPGLISLLCLFLFPLLLKIYSLSNDGYLHVSIVPTETSDLLKLK